MTQSIKTYEFAPSTLEQQVLTIAFCLQQYNQLHELYITHFLRLCRIQKITCKPHYFYPINAETMVDDLRHTPCSFIICLDNQFAALILNARTKLSLGAPLLYVDWDAPTTLPKPLPAKCFTLSLPMASFAGQLCTIIRHMQTVKRITILYCPNDPILITALPAITQWLNEQNYIVKTMQRTPTITGADVVTFAHYDLLIFLCRTAPEDYMRRLATVCKEQRTMLYVTNPLAILYGATCTFGPNTIRMAEQTISLIQHYLNSLHITPQNTTSYEIQINKQHATHSSLHPLFMTLAEKANS